MDTQQFAMDLEKNMLSYDDPKIPEPVKARAEDPSLAGYPVGIGHRDDVGWFILGTGQGPYVIWLENEDNWKSGHLENGVDIRVSQIHTLDLNTDIHMELIKTFIFYINEYGKKYPHLKINQAEGLQVVRYDKGGFYKPHVDSGNTNRILSGVLYLNEDFNGGVTHFEKQDLEVEPKSGRLVLYPSNFVYVREVKEITDRSCYSVTTWFK